MVYTAEERYHISQNMSLNPLLLSKVSIKKLHPTSPFHFDATFYKPDHFPTPDNIWRPGIRWQTMRWAGIPLGLKFENKGTLEKPEICLFIFATQPLNETYLADLINEIRYRYSLDQDLTSFYRRFSSDEQLGPVISRWRGMRDLNCSSLYEYLMIAIVLQNATVRRSVSMMSNLLQKYGDLLEFDGQRLQCFWEPETIATVTESDLRTLKVGYRAKTIRRLTETFVSDKVNEQRLRHEAYEIQRRVLLDLYGIGPASVGYILSAVFHHVDELQHISPWEQKIYSKLFFGCDPQEPIPAKDLIIYLTDLYGGYRAIAIHYFWEDLFWKWKNGEAEWLNDLIKL